MKKTTLVGIIVAVVVIAVGGFVIADMNSDNEIPPSTTTENTNTSTDNSNSGTSGNSGSSTPNDNPSATDEVEIDDFAFAPATITVKKGTTVKWTNKDDVQHNVAPDQTSDAFKGGPMLSKGDSYTFTFNTAGTFTYHCTPHPQMKGTVVVTE